MGGAARVDCAQGADIGGLSGSAGAAGCGDVVAVFTDRVVGSPSGVADAGGDGGGLDRELVAVDKVEPLSRTEGEPQLVVEMEILL